VPGLTGPVTAVDDTIAAVNPSSVDLSTAAFTLALTGHDTGGGLAYFEVFVSIEAQAPQQIGPAIPTGAPDSQGNDRTS
jgi:hypothetical protein